MRNINNLINLSKTTVLIPLFALTLHSCESTKESGIVKDKIDNKVYLTPVNDTDNVYRVINFDRAYKDCTTKNLYLNMNRGDTVVYYNMGNNTEIIPSHHHRHTGIIGGSRHTVYSINSINSVNYRDLPNLVAKQKEDEAVKKLQEEFEKAKQR